MRKLLLSLAFCAAALPLSAQAQSSEMVRYGLWGLLADGETCTLATRGADGSFLTLNALSRDSGGISFLSDDTRRVQADARVNFVLSFGTDASAALVGVAKPIGGQGNGVIATLSIEPLVDVLRVADRIVMRSPEGAPYFELEVPDDSGDAFDAFTACRAKLPAKAD